MATPAERDVTATASGVRLRVVEQGTGPAVVLIHGLFVDHRSWDPVLQLLAAEFRVIAPDLPGFGQSEKPPSNRFPYSIEAFAEVIADLFAGMELGRAALVGHGLGGAVALTLAARHPELVSHLVLVGPLSYSDNPDLESRLARMPLVGNLLFKQLVGRSLFRAYFRERLLSPHAKVETQRIDAFYDSFNSAAARGSALTTLRASADMRAVIAQTSRVRSPTLVVWGQADALHPPRFGQRLSREIRGGGFELLDSGHMPQEERPRELAQLLARFLRERRA